MKTLIENLYKYLFTKDILHEVEPIPMPLPTKVLSNREKLIKIAQEAYNTDPTPLDEVPDETSCVFSLTTLIKRLLPDFPILDYTPKLVEYLKTDKRFKESTEFKEGNIIVFPTLSGNNKIMGHCFIVGKNGKMFSNSSLTGLWSDKYDTPSMIERYSRYGGLALYIFELI